MRLDDIIQNILSCHSELSRQDILKMIDKKQSAAKGFLTNKSAARLVAAEFGINCYETSIENEISVKDLISGLGDVTITARVFFINSLKTFKKSDNTDGKIRHLFVADKTGMLKIVLWDDMAEAIETSDSTGKIIRFHHGYVRHGFDGKLQLNLGSKGELEVLKPQPSKDDYPPLSKFITRIRDITGQEDNVNVFGRVIKILPISTFNRNDGSKGKVRRLELRDGSGWTTVVLWNRKVDELDEITSGKFLKIYGAKVKRSLSGDVELHINSSVGTAVLNKGVD